MLLLQSIYHLKSKDKCGWAGKHTQLFTFKENENETEIERC